jgi:osmotically-inducible protein OsmY
MLRTMKIGRSTCRFVTVGVTMLLFLTTACYAEPLTDTDIANAVEDQLMADSAVPANNIDVLTVEGIVTLDGTVNNILAKDRAQKVAATVKGVRGIINRIEVSAAFRTDAEIEEDIKDALLWDPVAESWEITAAVSNAIATLSGTADSWQEKEVAAKVAKGVRGVKGIENEVTVDYQTDRLDSDIRDEIVSALRWDAYVDDALITVSVEDGAVTLGGAVGSSAEKSRARSEAWVAGVTSVDNSALEVKWWARDDRLRTDKYLSRSDEEIKEAVTDTFLYDPRVMSYQIDVESNGGYVKLRGTVDNLKAKRAAAQDARSVVGVWSVNNKIKVRSSTPPSDSRIERNVTDALERDPYVDRYQIDVNVVDGVVDLYGAVDSMFEKSQADDLAARQNGVNDVNNFLTVNNAWSTSYNPYRDDLYLYDYDWYIPMESASPKSDWEIKEDIESEIFWSPFVDSDAVSVEVDNGIARLTGTVDSWVERNAASENAREGGAVVVDNDLVVSYGPIN